MSFRLRKLRKITSEQGLGAAIAFVVQDLYFRALHLLAFPLHREKVPSSQRDLLGELVAEVSGRPATAVLEIGSRAVSDTTVRALFPATVRYVGFDLLPGPNVDVTGDAHELSSHFPPESFDAVFSRSVFEHLLMPWKAILEINHVLKVGGLCLVATHPTWPPHELPWDFWRYQENAFWALFNPATGFELIATATSTPARLFPASRKLYLSGTVKTICPMGVVALARKTGPHDPRLAWPITVRQITPTSYPTSG